MKIRIYPKSLLETVWQQDKLLFTPEACLLYTSSRFVEVELGCGYGAFEDIIGIGLQ